MCIKVSFPNDYDRITYEFLLNSMGLLLSKWEVWGVLTFHFLNVKPEVGSDCDFHSFGGSGGPVRLPNPKASSGFQ